MEVQILLCQRVLRRIRDVEDESITFLANWLSSRQIKAVVLPRAWNEFTKEVEEELRGFPESQEYVLGILRGILTPYRDKYAHEAGVQADGEVVGELDELSAMRTITTRHYASCMYLVTYAPEIFRGNGLRLPDTRILTPDLFQAELRTTPK
jgi:hypothetical protein